MAAYLPCIKYRGLTKQQENQNNIKGTDLISTLTVLSEVFNLLIRKHPKSKSSKLEEQELGVKNSSSLSDLSSLIVK